MPGPGAEARSLCRDHVTGPWMFFAVVFDRLHTERLELLPISPDLAPEMFEGLQHPQLYKYIGGSPPPSRDWLFDRYARLAAGRSPDGSELWLNWLLRRKDSSRLIGFVQATVQHRRALVAYLLFPEASGFGYAGEAVTAMIGALERDAGVTELVATVHTKNRRSIRVLERLNFVQTALKKDAEIIAGVSTDEFEYVRTTGSQ